MVLALFLTATVALVTAKTIQNNVDDDNPPYPFAAVITASITEAIIHICFSFHFLISFTFLVAATRCVCVARCAVVTAAATDQNQNNDDP